MSAIQTSYGNMASAAPGLLKGAQFDSRTGIVETAAGIGFGKAVSRGSADAGVILGGSLAAFLGISLRDVAQGAEQDEVAQYGSAGILTRGQVWVTAAEAVTAGNGVYMDTSTGALGDSTAGSKVGPIPGAVWRTSAASGALAIVELAGLTNNGVTGPTGPTGPTGA